MRTVFDITADQIQTQANQVDKNYRTQRRQVLNDITLSQEGKRIKLESLEANRVSAIAALQEKAVAELAEARTKHAAKLQAARLAAEEKERAALGDVAMMALLERRLRRARADDVVRMVQDSASDWQRQVVSILAADVIDERLAGGAAALVGGEHDYHVHQAYAELQKIVANARPAELTELEQYGEGLKHADKWIESLDADAKRRYMSNMGVSYESALAYADEQDKVTA